jgi:hypothetical protein
VVGKRIYAVNEDLKEKAAKNLDAAIDANLQFPKNVFRDPWDAFFFFDSGWLFKSIFVENIKGLLSWENGSIVCLRNLDLRSTVFTFPPPTDSEERSEPDSVFLDKEMAGEAYVKLLAGPSAGMGWISLPFRYACTSNIGSWYIYCERNSGTAVLAVRWKSCLHGLESVLESLGAVPIEQVRETPPCTALSSRGGSVEWRNKLIQEYAPRNLSS